jgi:hypothetical protein
MKKTLVLGLCCSVAAVALAANPGKLSKVAAPTLDSKLIQPAKVAPVRPMEQTADFNAKATGPKADMVSALAEYEMRKEAGLPISEQLMRDAFGPQPVGNSRQGGDTAATATAVGALPYTDSGTTVGYAGDIGPFSNVGLTCPWVGYYSATSSGAGPDVFYSWTITTADTYTISLCGSSYDTALAIYQDLGGGVVGTQVAGSDDSCSLQSQITCNALTPGNYFVVVDGWGTSSGAYTLNISGTGGVSPCDGAPTVVCGGSYPGDTTGDSNFAGNPAPDNVFVFNSTQAQTLTLSLCGGSTWDTYLRIYDDCPNVGLELASNDDFCGLQSELEYVVGVGTYYILVEGFGSNFGTYTLNVNCSTCSPITCTGADEDEAGGNDGPNEDPVLFGEIACGTTVCGTVSTIGDTLRDLDWFELLLANDGIVTVDLNVESFNGILFFIDSDASTLLYSADLNGFCEDETLTTECLPAGIYYVVAGPNGFSGVDVPAPYGLSVSCEPCTFVDPCDAFDAAVTTIGGFPYSDNGTIIGAPDVLDIGSGAVGYLFTLTETSSVTFSACQPGSDYDIDTYLFDANGPCNGGTQLFYNDGNSACQYAAWASEWTQDCTLGAGTYMLVVTGYFGAEGNFEFLMDVAGCACPPITCTGDDENEAGGNDGPNEDPVLFGSIACGETVCGTVATFGDTLRDLDWFELVLANDAIVTANLDVESFNGMVLLIAGDASTLLSFSDNAGFCGDEVLVSECLQAGTYYVVVGPNAFSGVDTPANYGLSVSCEACTWVDPYTACQTVDAPDAAWTFGISEVAWPPQVGYLTRFERFGAAGVITALDFVGLSLTSSFALCAEDPMPFNINFYDLSNTLVASYTPSLSGTLTGQFYVGFESMNYHFDLPAPLNLTAGYLEIQGAGDDTCLFLWGSSTGADAASILDQNGVITTEAFDLNYCFTLGAAPCDPVVDLTITKNGPNVDLNWTATAGAVSYNVYESADAYTLGALVANVPATTTSFSIAGAKKFYIVTAVCP